MSEDIGDTNLSEIANTGQLNWIAYTFELSGAYRARLILVRCLEIIK
jgi:hypothetical protein